MEDFSKSGMVSFAEMMTSKGWINSNTGGGYKAALNKVLGDLSDDTDVRTIDVKTQILRYNNLHPGELSPASLKQYDKRVRSMIAYYLSWKEDPTNFKPPQRAVATDKPEKASKPTKATAQKTNGEAKHVSAQFDVVVGMDGQKTAANERNGHAGSAVLAGNMMSKVASLSLPFPMRDDYLAQVTIPRDMSKEEATRLCTFIQALARE
jgi:hypothetical protein